MVRQFASVEWFPGHGYILIPEEVTLVFPKFNMLLFRANRRNQRVLVVSDVKSGVRIFIDRNDWSNRAIYIESRL